jgi:hypothetical protein
LTSKNVLSSSEATGVVPPNADAVLKRFRNTISDRREAPRSEVEGDNGSWRQVYKVFDAAVKDKAEELAQKLRPSLHFL